MFANVRGRAGRAQEVAEHGGRRRTEQTGSDARHSTNAVPRDPGNIEALAAAGGFRTTTTRTPHAARRARMLRLAARHAARLSRPSTSRLAPLRPSFRPSLAPAPAAVRFNSSQPPTNQSSPHTDATEAPEAAGAAEAFEAVEKMLEEDEEYDEDEEYMLEEDDDCVEVEGEDADDFVAEMEFPDLMQRDPLLDNFEMQEFPGEQGGRGTSPYTNRIIIRNDSPPDPDADQFESMKEHEHEMNQMKLVPMSPGLRKEMHVYRLLVRHTTQQTSKGKINRESIVVIIGNGNGLLGYGQGKHYEYQVADRKAIAMAYRNLDYVDRFENRTFWTELESKFGGTRIIMRPRPVGFGLRCNPNVHQILKAAGIKDASVKVVGSRTAFNVIMCTLRMLLPGAAPLGMGDGIGGKGQRMLSGRGMRAAGDIERERGRKVVGLRL